MELFKVTITPEQETAMQERLAEVAQGFMQMREQLRQSIPALQLGAALDEAIRRQAAAVTPRQ
ncbi:hypothetical protein R1Y80_09800 [Streptomyces sp. JL1001]|uniref:Uncharacterized protein n=1 Tax=Streptomyces sp. JL1001 TaxID=3078227 RepID=A0AAU8KG72_9ACTN